MSPLICTTFLVFGFTVCGLKLSNNKLPGPSFGVSETNITRERSTSHGFNFEKLIGNFVKFARDTRADTNNPTNSSDRKYARGKSKGRIGIVIPLIVFFKFMGMLHLSLAVVKFFLLKGFFGAKIALVILGVIFANRLRQFGTLELLKLHQFYFGNGPGQYPTNEPNLSGYGYEHNFAPGFQTPEQKYSSLIGKGRRQ